MNKFSGRFTGSRPDWPGGTNRVQVVRRLHAQRDELLSWIEDAHHMIRWLRARVRDLEQWTFDLQSGMYINCMSKMKTQRDEARALLRLLFAEVVASNNADDLPPELYDRIAHLAKEDSNTPTLQHCDICSRELGLIAPSEADAARVETPKGRLLICPQCREDDRQEQIARSLKP